MQVISLYNERRENEMDSSEQKWSPIFEKYPSVDLVFWVKFFSNFQARKFKGVSVGFQGSLFVVCGFKKPYKAYWSF